MNTKAFLKAYNETRNGCNGFIRHPLSRSFAYSDGVQECANAGCWWLIDILATELPAQFRKHAHESSTCEVKVLVVNGRAVITAEFTDGVIGWSKHIAATNLPDGEWRFYIADELSGNSRYRCILFSEY